MASTASPAEAAVWSTALGEPIVVDTSALIGVLLREEAADRLAVAVLRAPERRISAATCVEAGIVALARLGEDGEHELDLLVHRLGLDTVEVTAPQARLARTAYRQFGKGRHPAGLNYGDCFSYALARSLDHALLFTGRDFAQTDVRVAAY